MKSVGLQDGLADKIWRAVSKHLSEEAAAHVYDDFIQTIACYVLDKRSGAVYDRDLELGEALRWDVPWEATDHPRAIRHGRLPKEPRAELEKLARHMRAAICWINRQEREWIDRQEPEQGQAFRDLDRLLALRAIDFGTPPGLREQCTNLLQFVDAIEALLSRPVDPARGQRDWAKRRLIVRLAGVWNFARETFPAAPGNEAFLDFLIAVDEVLPGTELKLGSRKSLNKFLREDMATDWWKI